MKVIVDGQLIEYYDEGRGSVVLMLHGWGVDSRSFKKLAAGLSDNYRVIRFDFPGFGGSQLPSQDWRVEDYARCTSNFLNKIGVNEILAVIAHSFGSRVIIKAISKKYLNPKKIILIGAAGIRPIKPRKRQIYKIIAKVGKFTTSLPVVYKLQPKLKKALYKSAGSMDYINSGQMKQIFINTVNEDLTDEISKIQIPTFLIWGQDDIETPVEYGKKINELIVGSKMLVFKKCSHYVFIERSEEVINEIKDFIK